MSLDDTSVYPLGIDGYATLPLRKNLVHEIRAEDHNRLRNAIVKIEQELGIEPSGTYATVSARLDDIGDAKTLILAHIADTTDAHDASAISVLDTADNYFEDDVENVLAELATLLPPSPDTVGTNSSKVPNSGIPTFVDGYGTKHVFNTSYALTIAKRTQPSQTDGVRGIYIIQVGDGNPNGNASLWQEKDETGAYGAIGDIYLHWKAPGDSTYGDGINITTLGEGEEVTLSSSDTTKRVRVARTSMTLNQAPADIYENFEVYAMDQVKGYFSFPSEGFKYSRNITRAAPEADSATSRLQFMISGMVFPADRGTLVLQRKLRGVSEYYPIATIDLAAKFNNDRRSTGQLVYTPTLSQFDHFLLFDRLPVSNDYVLFTQTSDGTQPYDNFENTFARMQVAKYLVPVSVPATDTVGGTLDALYPPSAESDANIDAIVSAYRLVHYKDGVTDFNGNPSVSDIYSLADFDEEDNGETGIQFSNLFVDTSYTRPGIENIRLRPENPSSPSDDATLFTRRSGVRYYNSAADLFDLELRSDNSVFANTYLVEDILRFETRHFNFPNAQTGTRTLGAWDNLSSTVIKYGASIDIEELYDGDAPGDGYLSSNKFSSSNLPYFGDQAFYIINGSVNPTRRLSPNPSTFSNRAFVTGRIYDPFGAGDGYDAYGYENFTRILVNTYPVDRSTADTEWFTDESKRVGSSELFNYSLEYGQFTDAFGANLDGYTLTQWDPNIALSAGELQCGGLFTDDEFDIPGLIFPQNSYRADSGFGIMPLQASGATEINQRTAYSSPSFQIDSTYQRLFNLGYAIGGGNLRIVSGGNNPIAFEDIRYGNVDRFAKIEVKIPGNDTSSTGWLDIGKLFKTGKFEDGDGALDGAVIGTTGDFTVPFTFGSRNNANTGYMVAVRITYFGGQFNDAKTRILTMVKLEA